MYLLRNLTVLAVFFLFPAQQPAVVGPEHVPIAVRDLDAAAARYRAMGFSLKRGTPHANGIDNWHAKFRDGTEIELITAPRAVDALTSTYVKHLAQGDGPAFLAMFARDLAQVTTRYPAGQRPAYMFFGTGNFSPTDTSVDTQIRPLIDTSNPAIN